MVSTGDSESPDPGSSPGGTLTLGRKIRFVITVCAVIVCSVGGWRRCAAIQWTACGDCPVAGPARSASTPPDEESDGGKVARPKGRRRHWSEAQDVLGLKAILGVSAHVAARGTRTKQVVTAGTVVIDPFSQKLSWQSLVRSSFRWLTDSLRSLSSHRTISQKLSDVAVGAGDVGQRETVARRPVGSGG